MIHLARAKEREPLIRALEDAVQTSFEIREAVDGSALVAEGHPTVCGIHPGLHRTAGEIGCAASHLAAYRSALADGLSHLVVFEDDCAAAPGFSLLALRTYLARASSFAEEFSMKDMTEFVLLSTCGCYSWRHLTRGVKVTNHFNGSHAYIIGRKMMQKVVDFYDALAAKSQTAPIDGVIPIVLQQERYWAFCPEEDTALFKQNRDIPSYVVGAEPAIRTG
jgi:GR25 family glycosyltransferase involved in LPS biosynthesis